MGIDVVFRTVFPEAKPAAVRFVELCSVMSQHPDFRGPVELEVYELTNSGNPIATARGSASNHGINDEMRRIVAERATPQYSFRSTWTVQRTRHGRASSYSIDVTARAPLARRAPDFERDLDVIWDIGDSRRYTPEGVGDYPSVEEVIADLGLLVELGARSIWAAGPGDTLDPLQLYVVFHRDPNDFRDDGLARPLPPWPVDELDVEVAEEYARREQDTQRLLHSTAGPIIYSPLLVRGSLNMFYTYLDEVLRAGMVADIQRTNAAAFQAFDCRENGKTWISIERKTDALPLVKLAPIRQDADVLLIDYEITDPGLDDQLVRVLVYFTVLRGLYGDAYRQSNKPLCYRNALTGKESVVPYGPP